MARCGAVRCGGDTFRTRQVGLARAADTLAEAGAAVNLSREGRPSTAITTTMANTGGFWLTVPFDERLVRTNVSPAFFPGKLHSSAALNISTSIVYRMYVCLFCLGYTTYTSVLFVCYFYLCEIYPLYGRYDDAHFGT